MNPDPTAQLQALLNQAQQQSHNIVFGYIAISVACLLIGCLVTYMFYACLRDIADELRKFRIAYEFSHTPESRSKIRQASVNEGAGNPFAGGQGDVRYMPKH